MADLGRIVAGFIGGASGTALEFIKANEEDKRELRKAELLQKLRLQTSKELADYQQKLDQSELDKDLTTIEGNEVVMRDKAGNIIRRRAQTEGEKELESYNRESRSLDLEGSRAKIRSLNASASADAARGRAYDRQDAGGLDSLSDEEKASIISEQIFQEIRSGAEGAAKAATSAGTPDYIIDGIISDVAAAVKEKRIGTAEAVRQARDAIDQIGSAYTKGTEFEPPKFDRDLYDSNKRQRAAYRKARGLGG